MDPIGITTNQTTGDCHHYYDAHVFQFTLFSYSPTSSAVVTKPISTVTIPDWTSAEVDKKMEENTKYLLEWTTLLDKTGNYLYQLHVRVQTYILFFTYYDRQFKA